MSSRSFDASTLSSLPTSITVSAALEYASSADSIANLALAIAPVSSLFSIASVTWRLAASICFRATSATAFAALSFSSSSARSFANLTGYSWHNRPSSSLWSAGCIYSILHNETYLGTLCQGRQLTPEGQFHSKKNIPKDQWVRTVGHHPAIIDDELLRRELKARKEAGAHNLHEQKKNFPPGIFGKEVRCASCGKILTKGKTLRKTGYERTLFCPTRKKSPSHCKGAFISEKHLESAILHELKNLADRYSDDRVQIGICQDAQSADLIQERNRLKTAVELIEKEITAYEQRSRDLYLKRATDDMSIDDFNSALSRIRNDVDKLRLKSKRASSELLHLNESIAAESIRMETVLKAADFNHLDKTKVSMLIESVYVHKRDPKSGTQAIDITWKF